MQLNDVWRNVSQEIGVYWKGRFDQVPAVPGVYAWFYPLRISSKELSTFLADLSAVISFDASSGGKAEYDLETRIGWDDLQMKVNLNPAAIPFPPEAIAAWQAAVDSQADFDRLRRIVMRGSLFVPPLYVGKTKNLSVRCQQHLSGTGQNDFHRRFETYASAAGLQAQQVKQLLFACVRTESDGGTQLEGVVEEILKRACRPRYSQK